MYLYDIKQTSAFFMRVARPLSFHKIRFERLCMPLTVYSLFLYIMSCTEEEFDKTFFLFGGAVPSSIKSKFKNSYAFRQYDQSGLMSFKLFRELVYWRYVKWIVIPKIKRLKIYAQDHINFCSYIIGKRNYTLLEDAPHSNVFFEGGLFETMDINRRKMKRYNLARLIYGPIYGHSFGHNSQCTELLMWKYDDTDFIRSKKCRIVDLPEEWKTCTEDKRKLISFYLDIDDDDVSELNKYPIILLTQPALDPSYQSRVRHAVLYYTIAHKYPIDQIIIKTHPRDRFEYERILPEYRIFRKPIPLQLLSFMGIKFEKAVTAYSSSVLDFDYPIEIDWYGRGCGPLLPDSCRNFPTPPGATLCEL